MRYLVIFSLLFQLFSLPVWASAPAKQEPPLRVTYQNQQGLAVLELTTQGNVPAEMGQILTDRIRALILNSQQYQVMERSQMESIIKEQGFQASMQDCDTVSCAIKLGRLLSVRHLLIGSLSQVGQLYSLNLRIIDVQSGQIMNERFSDCRCSLEEVLMKVSPSLVKELLSGEAPAPVAAPVTSSYKNPVSVFLLNIPGPFGYFYMEEWGWFGSLLAIDLIAVIALIANNWSAPGGEMTAWLALAGTRIFGMIHGPAAAVQHNNELKLAQQEKASPQTIPLVKISWDF